MNSTGHRGERIGQPVRRNDAAELLEIACEPLPAVVRAPGAIKPEPPRLWEDAPDSASEK
jgi:hypothetical protein